MSKPLLSDEQITFAKVLILIAGLCYLAVWYVTKGSSVSRDCTELANKVLSASAEKAAEEGGQLTSFSNLKEISTSNKSIICKGYFKGNGIYRSDTYTISEDNKGIYWRTPGRIEFHW